MRSKNPLASPFLKWVGGKRQLLDEICRRIPKRYKIYCEPFVGGGAVFFSLQRSNAIINDINSELINAYEIVKGDVSGLINDLQRHKNDSEYYYKIRDLDRNKEEFEKLSKVERASRFIYLNKTCYNGLYRINNAGEFNTPFGAYKNPAIVNGKVLQAVSQYLQKNNVKIYSKDYAEVLSSLPPNSFVYLDPPYDPVSSTANFTGYSVGGFDKEDQNRLKMECDNLTKRKIKFLLSNSATDFIQQLYQDYTIEYVNAKRAINSIASKRGEVEEVLVMNYKYQ
ncbi:MAG TPA: DNA adenine methylase [Methanocorpusculum sp.]|nr:DNA adenine methylase [Methanocorpusculum sp.]